MSVLLNYLLPSSRAGTPSASRCTTPITTPQNTPPSSPTCSHPPTTSAQPSPLQGKELLVSPASDDIPSVIIHPPEEDLEVQESHEKKTKENTDKTPGNYCNLSCPCVMLSASGSLALRCFWHITLAQRNMITVTFACMFYLFLVVIVSLFGIFNFLAFNKSQQKIK